MKNTKPSISVLLLAMALVFAAGCKKNNTNGNPDNDVVVATYKPSAITASTAACGCDVEVVQGLSLTKIGVCWSTSKNPTVEDASLSSETWDEPFNCTLTGLTSGTTYHVRGFALRGLEYYYGDDRTFTTLGSGGSGGGNGGGGYEPPTPFGPGSGTQNDPYNVASVMQLPTGQTEFWARGYIVGVIRSGVGLCEPPFDEVYKDVAIANDPYERDANNCITVNQPLVPASCAASWLDQVVLFNHPENLRRVLTVYGKKTIEKNISGVSVFTLSGGLATSLPSAETKHATAITGTSATIAGEVLSDGGATTRRGLCWSTSSNPTVDDGSRDCGTGLGNYSIDLAGLSPSTTYHVRAYAVNSYGVGYGDDVSFTTAAGSGSTTPPTGAINGLFSVSPSKQVWFSQGNLQYKAYSKTWRFAEKQWHFVGTSVSDNPNGTGGNVSGSSNHRVSSTYSGWIDWFCWGTSGYNHGAVAYQPWSTSAQGQDYYAYGSPNYNLYDQTGQADWGYNKISNGGNQENYGWRTPTIEEWEYLIDGRNTPSGIRYVCAKVNGVYGLILLPDNWVSSIYVLKYPNIMTNGNDNVISASNWANKLQAEGAVFLPEAGYRHRNKPTSDLFCFAHFQGDYWSSSSNHFFEFRISYPSQFIYYNIGTGSWGVSVRLVKDYQ